MKSFKNTCTMLLVLIVGSPTLLFAQPFDDDVLDNPVPFDSGVILLVVIAIAYGASKVIDKKKSHKL